MPKLPTSKFNLNHKGRMKVLLAMDYKGNKVYVRMIDKDLFIWDAVYQGNLFSSYIVITPPKGKKLTKSQIAQAAEMCYAGAAATIDLQMGIKLDTKTKENVKLFEGSRKQVENLPN